MIAALMLYSLVISTCFALAAATTEDVLRLMRRPTRFVWVIVMLVAIGFSAARFRSGLIAASPVRRSPAESAAHARAESPVATPPALTSGESSRASFRVARALLRRVNAARVNAARVFVAIGSTMTRFDEPLLVAWTVCSTLGLLIIAFAALRLARPHPRWSTTTVDDVPVLVSHDLGPAAIGVFHYRIVLPVWALTLPPAERDLVLAHEREHAAVGDPSLLFVATLLVALTPWNAALWWMARRLRVAIELDCDARVLRTRPDPAAYGALLLAVSERTRGGTIPIVALAEPMSLVERRIAAIMSRAPRFVPLRAAVATAGIAGLILAACVAPSPVHAPDATITPAEALASVSSSRSTVAAQANVIEHQRNSVDAVAVPKATLADSDLVTRNAIARLFDGIALSADQEHDAQTIIKAAFVTDQALSGRSGTDTWSMIIATEAERDTALKALLTSDHDRATFEARTSAELARLVRLKEHGGP